MMASSRPNYSKAMKLGGNSALPLNSVDTSKRYKRSPPLSIVLQRLILKFRLFPRPLQIVIGLSVIGMGCFLTVSSLPDPSARFKNRPHLPDKPRVLQLMEDHINAEPLATNDVPTPGERTLIDRYNPMPNDNAKLKQASTLDKGGCQKAADWQVGHNPNCNVIHESTWGWDHIFSDRDPELMNDYAHSSSDNDGGEATDDTAKYEQARLVAGGAFRHVWMIKEFDGTKRALKTLRVDSKSKNFDLRSFDRHRRDAVAIEQLTWSPLVVNIYGYCVNSALYDWGEGGDLESIFERDPDISKEQLLKIAYNVSLSLAHAHNLDEQGHPTMAHTDIKVDQFLYQDGYYRLTDFNRVRFLMWNEQKDLQCGFRVQKNGGAWRSPEEYSYQVETEKVDVYSLGNVLYFLLTRLEPWENFRTKEIYELVKDKKRPSIPDEIRESDHPYDKYMLEAIEMAYTHNMYNRPGALEVANKLKEGIGEL